MSFPCNFCGSVLSSKSNLTAHQKKTVKCLEIQYAGIKTINDIKNEQQFECERCDSKFAIKVNLDSHRKICETKESSQTIRKLKESSQIYREQNIELKILVETLKEQVKKLEDQLAKERQNQQNITLAAITKPTTQVKNTMKNCIIQNLTPLLESEMKDQSQYLTVDHIKAGAEGYAKYALEYPLKDKFICSDKSRKKLAYKDPEGIITYDEEGSKLSEKFFRSIKERNLKLCRETIEELGNRCDAAYKREDLTEAEAIVNLTDKICNWRKQAMDTSRGEDSELKNDFVKYLCIASKTQ